MHQLLDTPFAKLKGLELKTLGEGTLCVSAYVRACMRVNVRACMYARVCVHARMRVYVCTHVCACMCARTYARACVRAYSIFISSLGNFFLSIFLFRFLFFFV